TEVPASLWKLKNLRVLVLPHSIAKLPPGIGNLSALESWQISGPALHSVARELSRLTSLHTLRIEGNAQVEELPDEIGELANLTKLSAYHLGLTSVPASITKLAKLRELSLSGNTLTQLAWILCALPNLRVLHHYRNPLSGSEKHLINALLAVS